MMLASLSKTMAMAFQRLFSFLSSLMESCKAYVHIRQSCHSTGFLHLHSLVSSTIEHRHLAVGIPLINGGK